MLDKKSPGAISAWQKRYCVFTMDGKLYYYESSGSEAKGDHKKEPLDLTKCSRLTSDNIESCHFEIHGCKLGKGPVQFRVSKQRWEIEGGIRGDFNYYDKNEWEAVKIVFEHLASCGILTCNPEIEPVSVSERKRQAAKEKSVMSLS